MIKYTTTIPNQNLQEIDTLKYKKKLASNQDKLKEQDLVKLKKIAKKRRYAYLFIKHLIILVVILAIVSAIVWFGLNK